MRAEEKSMPPNLHDRPLATLGTPPDLPKTLSRGKIINEKKGKAGRGRGNWRLKESDLRRSPSLMNAPAAIAIAWFGCLKRRRKKGGKRKERFRGS